MASVNKQHMLTSLIPLERKMDAAAVRLQTLVTVVQNLLLAAESHDDESIAAARIDAEAALAIAWGSRFDVPPHLKAKWANTYLADGSDRILRDADPSL